jgi:hypothetical protein
VRGYPGEGGFFSIAGVGEDWIWVSSIYCSRGLNDYMCSLVHGTGRDDSLPVGESAVGYATLHGVH